MIKKLLVLAALTMTLGMTQNSNIMGTGIHASAAIEQGVENEKNTFTFPGGDRKEQKYDIADTNIRHVKINGSAKSVIIKQSAEKYFGFCNADLKKNHSYKVRCDEDGDTLDIIISMENAEDDNNILGSFIVYIPEIEFEKIEATGDFKQIHFGTMKSDVFVHDNNSVVVLDIEADLLDHNITLDGSESNTFPDVSVYFDKLPDNVKMDLNGIQDGRINDQQNILNKNSLEAGSGEPVISITNANGVNIYVE